MVYLTHIKPKIDDKTNNKLLYQRDEIQMAYKEIRQLNIQKTIKVKINVSFNRKH